MLSDYLLVSLDKFQYGDFMEYNWNKTEVKTIRIVFPSTYSLSNEEMRLVLHNCVALKGLETVKFIFLEGADIPFEALGSALKQTHHNIVNLHIDCVDLKANSKFGLNCFNESLVGHPSLKEFKLNFEYMDEGSTVLDSIAQAVSAVSSLESVWIYVKPYPRGSSSGLNVKSSDLLCRSPNLLKLKLGGLQLSDGHVEVMSRALHSNAKLQEISMWRCNVSSQGAINISRMLRANMALKTIDLSWNNIDDIGCVALAQALETNSTLQSLNIRNVSIGKSSSQAFERMFQRNFVLKNLWGYSSDGETNRMITFYTQLNRSGKRDILRNDSATHDELVDTLLCGESNLSEIFYYVSKCPVLVESAGIVCHNSSSSPGMVDSPPCRRKESIISSLR